MSANHFIVALFKSFGLHIVIGVALVASVTLKAPQKPKPKVIEVQPITSVAVDKNQLDTQINKIKAEKRRKQMAEEKRVKDLEDRARKARRETEKREKQIKDLAKKKRQSEAEKRKADAAAKKAREKQRREKAKADKAAADAAKKLREKKAAEEAAAKAKAKRIAEEKAAKKAEADRKAKAERERKERERKAREARERAEAEAALQQQMAEEQAARERIHAKRVDGEIQRYMGLIKARIEQVFIKDASMKGKSCLVNIKMAFNGLVTSVKILSGDRQLCQAAEAAILKVGKMPMSEDPAVREKLKDVDLNYIPDFD